MDDVGRNSPAFRNYSFKASALARRHKIEQRDNIDDTRTATPTSMQTPDPQTGGTTHEASISELEDRLDELWDSYLVLLDRYTKAQDEIKHHMSLGFLSLAKAQSGAPLGKRYGRDWYDERMKASQRARVIEAPTKQQHPPTTNAFPILGIRLAPEDRDGHTTSHGHEALGEKGSIEEAKQQPSPPGTPESKSKSEPESASKERSEDSKSDEKNGRDTSVNPLHWYGILVPPELKRAQGSFSAAISDTTSIKSLGGNAATRSNESPMTTAVNAARGLREVEAELRRTRKAVKKAEKARGAFDA